MSRYLMLDIGAGTMDVLCYDTHQNTHYKAVLPSPTRQLAHKVNTTRGNILFTGCEMGGGPVSEAIINRAKKSTVLMSRNASSTVHHNPEKILEFGITIVEKDRIDAYSNNTDFHILELADIQPNHIRQVAEIFGIPFKFDVIAVCAQDHGIPSPGLSHLDFRHKQFSRALDKNPSLAALLHEASAVPNSMNRLSSIAKYAIKLPAQRVYVMDSGIAAILGASMDSTALAKKRIIVLDIATSHTVGAAIDNGVLAGFFEYHTNDITPRKLELLVKNLPEGKISYEQILQEGGHGAYIRNSFGYDTVQATILTGPMRRIMKNFSVPTTLGAPWGDNMMTGTTGLMEAVRLREKLAPIEYV